MSNPPELDVLSAALRAGAKAQGLSLAELARRSGVAYSRVHGLCHGTDSHLSTLFAVPAGLGEDLGWLARRLREPSG